jgi:hypothetical protein
MRKWKLLSLRYMSSITQRYVCNLGLANYASRYNVFL